MNTTAYPWNLGILRGAGIKLQRRGRMWPRGMTGRGQYRSTLSKRRNVCKRICIIQTHRKLSAPTSPLSFHCESSWISGSILFKKYFCLGRSPNLSLTGFPHPQRHRISLLEIRTLI